MIQYITFAIAVLGAVLGIINTWHAIDRTRVKLKVVPARAVPVGGAPSNVVFCVEVTNLSAFAVTVYDVGIFYKGTDKRSSIVNPILPDSGPWPRRLEPRSSVTVYSERPRTLVDGRRMKCVYAKTQCGHVERGTSGALKQMASEAEWSKS